MTEIKMVARPWTQQDLLDDLQSIIDEESDDYLNTRRNTLEMGLAYLKEHFAEQKWIPVSERLPEERDFVVVFTVDKTVGEALYDGHGQFYWSCADEYAEPLFVTHWMPLPEPPEVNNNG